MYGFLLVTAAFCLCCSPSPNMLLLQPSMNLSLLKTGATTGLKGSPSLRTRIFPYYPHRTGDRVSYFMVKTVPEMFAGSLSPKPLLET